MGKKYIVEIGRLERLYKASVNGFGKPNLTWLSPEVDLTPYTEPDLEQVRKEAYKDGYNAGFEKKIYTSYQEGLSDAWEAVKTLWNTPNRKEIFGHTTFNTVLTTLTAQETIEKIRQYEQEKEEIKVGDEVELKCGVRPAIYMQGTKGSDEISLLFNDGSCGLHSKSEIERKTGRHFPEIATALEKMRGEQDE